MFVLLSVTLGFLGYLICVKLIYYRSKRLWPSSRDDIIRCSSRVKDVNVLPTRDPPDSPSRTCGVWRVLLVTAHPDDECMFFAPALLKLTESNADVYLLCLSSGNYYNQGAQRKEELFGSCAVLGIPAHRVTIIDNKELQDDPKADWSIALTASLILKHITTHSINLVLTFDEGGVSGHANHIAIYKALSAQCAPTLLTSLPVGSLPGLVFFLNELRESDESVITVTSSDGSNLSWDLVSWVKETEKEVALWWAKPGHHGDFQELGYGFRAPSNHAHLAFVGRIPEDCQVLSLHTISILRKYLSILELPISWLLPSSFCCVIGPKEYKKAKEAMLRHRSQLLWFRRLYILFSRYMFINTFRAMPVEKKDVKFY